jgi:DNA-binding NtrC family response regulator
MAAKKWKILFIKDVQSMFDTNSKLFDELFDRTDFVQGREEALASFDANSYDIVIGDLSVDPKELGLLKQLQDKKTEQCIFAFVAPKDTDKLYGIADLGINAFELTPDQLEQALETIAQFNPYEKQV